MTWVIEYGNVIMSIEERVTIGRIPLMMPVNTKAALSPIRL